MLVCFVNQLVKRRFLNLNRLSLKQGNPRFLSTVRQSQLHDGDSDPQQDFNRSVDSAFNEIGCNEIFEFLNIHFFKPIFLYKDITMKGDKNLFFLGPLNFAK